MKALARWRPRAREWDRGAAAHLLRRGGFGASRERVDAAVAAGLDACVDELLARRAHDPALLRGVKPLLALGDVDALAAWWTSLVLGDGAPLVERVALMWHDHFATSNAKVDDVRMMHAQIELFRADGLGDFRSLLHAVAQDPALLVWLDGDENERGRPNENFARELLELFALGIGHYGERDVQETARAFTGRGTKGRAYAWRPERHDDGAKEILGARGRFDGDAAVDVVLAHPQCARHVARRVLAELVGDASEREVGEAAAVLVAGGWSVEKLVATILRSERFHDPRRRRSRIAAPLELVAGAALALGARVAPAWAARAASEMGQALLRPPSVEGWKGGRAWIDAGTWLARHNRMAELADAHLGAVDGVRVDLASAFVVERVEDVARGCLETLLPGVDDARLLARVEAAAREASDLDHALTLCAALVLTAPEYHVV